MKILFVTAKPHLPETTGGMQYSSNELIKRLQARGHDVSLMCGLRGKTPFGYLSRFKIKISRKSYSADCPNGYCVYRSWFAWEIAQDIINKVRPDIAVIMTGSTVKMAKIVRACGVPVVVMLQDVNYAGHAGSFDSLGDVPSIANSAFTARAYEKKFSIKSLVIHPIINPQSYRVKPSPDYVTFINPHKEKGLDTMLEVARACPEIPFLFVESWYITAADKAPLMKELDKLENVTFLPAQKDMKKIYGKTKILMVSSRCDEAFGRVVAEAQLSGIPVIASDRGGLPESVGEGGILISPAADADEWARALKNLWKDKGAHKALSDKALTHASRDALNSEKQADAWEQVLLQQSIQVGAAKTG